MWERPGQPRANPEAVHTAQDLMAAHPNFWSSASVASAPYDGDRMPGRSSAAMPLPSCLECRMTLELDIDNGLQHASYASTLCPNYPERKPCCASAPSLAAVSWCCCCNCEGMASLIVPCMVWGNKSVKHKQPLFHFTPFHPFSLVCCPGCEILFAGLQLGSCSLSCTCTSTDYTDQAMAKELGRQRMWRYIR